MPGVGGNQLEDIGIADEFFGLHSIINEMVFDGEPSIGMPPPANVSVTLTYEPVNVI